MPARRKPSSDPSPAGTTTALTKPSAAVIGAGPALVTDLRQLILRAREQVVQHRHDFLLGGCQLILRAREQVARAVDSALVLLYWSIGHRIRTDILKEKRAEYGQKIFHAVSGQLTAEFGNGFTERNQANMARFAEVFPDAGILHALSANLSWTHFRRIIYLDDPLKRDFYAEMCRTKNLQKARLSGRICLQSRTPGAINSPLATPSCPSQG